MGITPLSGEAVLLKVYLSESDKWHGKPLFDAIVMEARKQGLAGASVMRGVLSYGASKHFHSAAMLDLSMDLPMTVEMVDTEDKIQAFLPFLDEMTEKSGCLVTLQPVTIHKHQAKQPG